MEYNAGMIMIDGGGGEKNIFKPLPVANDKMHSFQISDYE
jgi:hypothetical protein